MKLLHDDARKLKVGLHMHTTRSDGRGTPEEVAAIYEAAGYDAIFLTDHWHAEGLDWRGKLAVLPGMEVDFNLDTQCVHMVALGVDESLPAMSWRDTRDCFRELGMNGTIKRLKEHSAIVELAHPAWSLNTVDVARSLDGLFATEIYNSVSRPPWNAKRSDSSGFVDICAANGLYLPVLAVDDAHFYAGDECVGYTCVEAESVDELKESLVAGRFYASQGPAIHSIELTSDAYIVRTSPCDMAVFYSNLPYVAGRTVTREGGVEWVYERRSAAGERYIRCEVIDSLGRSAWTNPVEY